MGKVNVVMYTGNFINLNSVKVLKWSIWGLQIKQYL